jgi:hypothetical protein
LRTTLPQTFENEPVKWVFATETWVKLTNAQQYLYFKW